jgi:hypothetical protein
MYREDNRLTVTIDREKLMDVSFRVGVLLAQLSRKSHVLQLDARIFHDLNIYGDDAHELLERLHDEFGLDVRDLNFREAFPPEFNGRWSRFFFWKKPKRLQKELFAPITVRQLIEACARGSTDANQISK